MLLSKHFLVLPLLLITAASPVASTVLKEAFKTKGELQAEVNLYCEAPESYNTVTYG